MKKFTKSTVNLFFLMAEWEGFEPSQQLPTLHP